jgi:hypothetical protein
MGKKDLNPVEKMRRAQKKAEAKKVLPMDEDATMMEDVLHTTIALLKSPLSLF